MLLIKIAFFGNYRPTLPKKEIPFLKVFQKVTTNPILSYFLFRSCLLWKVTANPILNYFLFGTAYIIHQISFLGNFFFRMTHIASVHSPSGSVACLFRWWVCITINFWELTFNPSHVSYIKIYDIWFPLFFVLNSDTIPIHLT